MKITEFFFFVSVSVNFRRGRVISNNSNAITATIKIHREVSKLMIAQLWIRDVPLSAMTPNEKRVGSGKKLDDLQIHIERDIKNMSQFSLQ